MTKVIVVNGSPRKAKGNTGLLLKPFIEGMHESGADVDVIYASELKILPCSCGRMLCWTDEPGVCCVKDVMQTLYPQFRTASIWVFATPMYIPFPGDMQNLVNRLCPLIEPKLTMHNGRTRAQLRVDVKLCKIALVATGGWWEKENLDLLSHIVQEIAANMNVRFAGAMVRPHAYSMCKNGVVTPAGQLVLEAMRLAGRALVEQEQIPAALIERIGRPLVPADPWLRAQNGT